MTDVTTGEKLSIPFVFMSSSNFSLKNNPGKQLQRILHYSVTPCRPLKSCIGRSDPSALYDVDCDEVYPRVYIGDA